MAWHIREFNTECSNYACNKRATVKVFNNFNSDFGPYCRACGKVRVAAENREQDEYNKFHRSGERLTKYKGAKS